MLFICDEGDVGRCVWDCSFFYGGTGYLSMGMYAVVSEGSDTLSFLVILVCIVVLGRSHVCIWEMCVGLLALLPCFLMGM